jgi:hypothetical protein
MSESIASQGRTKRIKLVGSDSVGSPPKEFSDNDNIAKMEFHIHDFSNREEKRGEYFYTGIINAHGHPWKLRIYPRGHDESSTDAEYVSVFLHFAGENTKTDPVVAKAMIRTKTDNSKLPKYEYSKEEGIMGFGCPDFSEREDIIKNDCNDAGTLTITVELQVATEKKSVWFPQLTYCDNIGTQLYRSTEMLDVAFIVGASKKEFTAHKIVLAVRARDLYELVVTEEESSSPTSSSITPTEIILKDVNESAFDTMMEFIYTGKVPTFDTSSSSSISSIDIVKSILITANRFGVMELKLYMESIIVEKQFLIPTTVSGLLLFADSYSCALLKEAAMNMYIADSITVIESSKDDWIKLQESSKLLTELLVYATSGRKKYSSVVDDDDDDDGNGTIDDADDFDVTSLRERLQNVNLDVDGSREILVERWKNYILTGL